MKVLKTSSFAFLMVLASIPSFSQVKVDTLAGSYVISSPTRQLGLPVMGDSIPFSDSGYMRWSDFMIFQVSKDTVFISPNDRIKTIIFSNWVYQLKEAGMECNYLPIADAGKDTVISGASTVLNGIGTDQDGTIKSYLWTKISGPNTGDYIQYPTQARTSVLQMGRGVYVYRLTVTDDKNATAIDFVNITKN